MKMLNVGIGPETGTNRELNSGDKPIDLQSGQGISCLQIRFYRVCV